MTVRHRQLLRRLYRAILGYAGLVYLITAGCLLLPLLALPFYPQEASLAWGFLLPAGALAALGALLWRRFNPREAVTLSWQEGAVVVLLAWIGAIVAGAAVFMLTHGLNFTQAVFEATSGWTTTGLSVIDVTQASHLVLLLRSVLQGAGGAGLAIIMLSTLAGPVGAGLSSAEGRSDQLAPHVRRSASLVLALYAGYAIVGTLALRAAGMSLFDAINHSLGAVSTGGFSTRTASIGYWDSAGLEAVTIVLMVFGNLNFLTSWAFFRGKFRAVLRNGEVRVMAVLFPIAAIIVLASVAGAVYVSLGKAVRVAIFEVVSAGTTTGFSTVGYLDWPTLPVLVLILLMLTGGGTGSTAGGIKQYRMYVLFRALGWELQRRLLPRTAVTTHALWVGEQRRYLDNAQIRDTAIFVFLYFSAFFVGTGILAAYGYSFRDSLFEFASSLGTVGLSIGVTTSGAPAGVLWTETAGMFLGRLEFYAVVVAVLKLLDDARAALPDRRRAGQTGTGRD
jgi:trk system potassium uptake protein TrkH